VKIKITIDTWTPAQSVQFMRCERGLTYVINILERTMTSKLPSMPKTQNISQFTKSFKLYRAARGNT